MTESKWIQLLFAIHILTLLLCPPISTSVPSSQPATTLAPLPVVKCQSQQDCPYNITCDPASNQCSCKGIKMTNKNCSEAFKKTCNDSLFGIFCEYKCPEMCITDDNESGKCDRIEGTCDDFDEEQDNIMKASKYWYIFLACAIASPLILMSVYLIDNCHRKRKAKKQGDAPIPPRRARANTVYSVPPQHHLATFEEPAIENPAPTSYMESSFQDDSASSRSKVASDNESFDQ